MIVDRVAPKCPVCGKACFPKQSWMHKDCAVANISKPDELTTEMVANEPVMESEPVANKHGKYADPEKRRAYMREYMAKRRAK